MNHPKDSLKHFNYLSGQLHNALHKKDYEAIFAITTEQDKLIKNLSNSGFIPTEEVKSVWYSELKFFQKLKQNLQSDLKKLNNNTRNNIRRLKGYSFK